MTNDLRKTFDAARANQELGFRRGLWLTFLSAYGLEAAVGHGADWVGVDLQHGDLELNDVAGYLRVTERVSLPLLTRMPSHDPALISRAIDLGVNGLIIPMVESASQARDLVSAVLTPPRGSRSTGSCRASLMVRQDPAVPLLLPMIETAAGFDRAAEIVSEPGVDGVFFGPYDLSVSAGYPSPDSPQTIAALRHVIKVARSADKIVGFMAGRPKLLAVAPEADLVAIDTDVSALRLGLGRLFAANPQN